MSAKCRHCGRAKGQTLYPKFVKTIAMKTIEINEIDAGAIEELARRAVTRDA